MINEHIGRIFTALAWLISGVIIANASLWITFAGIISNYIILLKTHQFWMLFSLEPIQGVTLREKKNQTTHAVLHPKFHWSVAPIPVKMYKKICWIVQRSFEFRRNQTALKSAATPATAAQSIKHTQKDTQSKRDDEVSSGVPFTMNHHKLNNTIQKTDWHGNKKKHDPNL